MLSTPELRMHRRRSAIRTRLFCHVGAPQYAPTAIFIVLMLMIVEMTFGNLPRHSLPVERYRCQNATPMPEALREDAMQLFLTRDGTFYFRNAKVSRSDLPGAIRESVDNGSPRKVFFVVDMRAKYWDVSQALDQVREAGVSDVAFLAEVPYIHR